MADETGIPDSLTAKVLERMLDSVDQLTERVADSAAEIALNRQETAALTEQVKIANGRTRKLEDRSTDMEGWQKAHDHAVEVAQAFKDGGDAKMNEIKGKAGRLWDFLFDEAKYVVIVLVLVAGYILGHVDFSGAIGLVWR